MKTAKSLLLLALMSIGFIGGIFVFAPVAAVHASSTNGGTPGPDGISPVTVSPPTSTSDEADYETTCPGAQSGCSGVPSTSWGATIFSVTYSGTVAITITDCCFEGDYYALYSTTDPSGLTGWTLVGTTDQVATGSELAAPTYDPAWTGTGSAYSSTTFNIPQTGTVLYAVRDVLFDTMVTLLGPSCGGGDSVVYSGCSATGISASSGWSPAGFYISFAPGTSGTGCLDSSGSITWATVTFTDSSTADVSVSGGAPPGACPSMSIEDLFTNNPAPVTPPVTSPNYYDFSITGLTAGTATLCITSSTLVSSGTTMMYWNGNSWVSATGITVTGDEICGNIPVTALDTPSTPVVIGTPSTGPSVPEFGAPAMMVAAIGMLGLALVSRRLRPILTR